MKLNNKEAGIGPFKKVFFNKKNSIYNFSQVAANVYIICLRVSNPF